jgi:hypothetical protein
MLRAAIAAGSRFHVLPRCTGISMDRWNRMKTLWLLPLTVISIVAHAQNRPNVVLMLGDHVCYGDVGAYGAGEA